MTDAFGNSGDTGEDKNNQGNFGNGATSDQGGASGQVGTAEEWQALRKRDEHAQQHIERLERENEDLRNKFTQLEDRLSSAATMEEVLNRLDNRDDGKTVDPKDVAAQVMSMIDQRDASKIQDDNWANVFSKVTEVYGSWDKANGEIQAKARTLGLSDEDATRMARTSPQAFYELFLPKSGTPTNAASAASRVGGSGQQGAGSPTGETRDQAWYSNLRRTNPNKYWSVEVQAQMRRDLNLI